MARFIALLAFIKISCLLACLLTSFARWYCLCLHCLSIVVSEGRYSFAFYVIDMSCVWSCSWWLLCLCELLYLLFLGSLLHTSKIKLNQPLYSRMLSNICLLVISMSKCAPNLMPEWTQKGHQNDPPNQPRLKVAIYQTRCRSDNHALIPVILPCHPKVFSCIHNSLF